MPFESIALWFCDNVVWGMPTVFLFLGSGIYLSYKTKFFQFFHLVHSLKMTVGSLFKKSEDKNKKDKSVSQLQVVSTALAATIGTGNIAGVATALSIGGAGAVFWMWVSAFLGMATAYSENLLAIFYRKKSKSGEYLGGAMYYLKHGLKSKRFFKKFCSPLSFIFAVFCLLASFGMGNMIQVNTISELFSYGVCGIKLSKDFVGIALAIFIGYTLFGGIKRILRITERLVPIMAFIYIFGTLTVIIVNHKNLLSALCLVFKGAFGINSALGGFSGFAIKKALETGLRRGIFSNEAGLGTSTLIGSCSEVTEPAIQGMWGIFTVFFDTIIGCSLTAFAILTSGALEKGGMGAAIVSKAFESSLGRVAGELTSILTLLFALSTVIGWSFYGIKVAEYLFGEKLIGIYKILFTVLVVPGAIFELNTVWIIADIFNGLMAIPNLIGIIALSGEIKIITENYKKRIFKGKNYIPPIISAYDIVR
jgi:AGCS family alanine or glycine:cation symporter